MGISIALGPIHRSRASIRIRSSPTARRADARLRGWLSFYEGDDLGGELKRIEAAGWRAEEANEVGDRTPRPPRETMKGLK